MMEGVGVEVLGVPNHLSTDQTIDKLTIHFLRKRNGGNQVQRVIYPSHHAGQAVVIFEGPYVTSSVLKQTHVVDFGHGCSAPVEVRAADRPEVDMPVKTFLDLSTFPNSSEVRRLLESHGFQITVHGKDRWHLTGSFMKLTAVKARLTELLEQETQALKKSSSTSPTINGHGYPHGATSKHYTSGTSAHGSRSPALLSGHHAPPPSPTLVSSRGSGSQQSKGSPPDHIASQSPRDPRSSGESPFMIAADVLHYAKCVRVKDIQMILETNESKMEVKAVESSDLSQVTVVGRCSRVAKQKLLHLLNDLTFTLRTQDIDLATLDHCSQVKVMELIQAHQDEYPLVVITHLGNTIHLTGPSADSYDFQQILKGKPISPKQTSQRGRLTDRGSGSRRSSSLPRVRTKDRTEGAPRSVATAQSHAQKKYQDNTRAVQVAAAEAPKVYSVRRRSLSVSQEEEREPRDTRKPETSSTVHSPEASSPREKKPSVISKLHASLQHLSRHEIKRKMSKNSKKPES